MATGFYAKARTAFARGEIQWRASGGDTFRAVLIDAAAYSADLTTSGDEFLADVPAAARIVPELLLTTLEPTDGVLDAADLLAVTATGASCEAIVIYQDTGSEATSRLVLYIDEGTGLPVTPTGVAFDITWGNGANRIAKL
jgi:hypothetical protein